MSARFRAAQLRTERAFRGHAELPVRGAICAGDLLLTASWRFLRHLRGSAPACRAFRRITTPGFLVTAFPHVASSDPKRDTIEARRVGCDE